MTGVVVSKASKLFGNRWLFSDLDINVSAGQLTAITGPSGSGKSTLLNCIGLLDKLDRGQILVGGRDISRLSAERQRKFRRDIVGYMFQDYALVENATVQENLEIALVAKGRSMVRSADFDGALERVGLPRRQREPVYQLSGGEQQRVALARLILKAPSVVIADEPTGALDSENEQMVLNELERIASEGASVLIATHSSTVANACSEIISLE
ncbi:putative ABC transport system ATP-binding protein [Arthrobacter sp. JUb119]|uniref:ATP-binding cassette domain-containing protein n=1 Tax=Micrococcaceae TaxID=1268 RepID=UPI000FA76B3E|nr:ATP-binding cassette domain-containing protein [Arthrobacter sp. JUb115]MCS3493109.1 putative ABC transport system ATP-binding protein [Arthrobacter sp. JUb119]TDU26172.1 putative ABC transport system ATP-binding protein [Arthrobacter sp. JUb115]